MTCILGIESSCDETAAAILCSDKQILAQAIASQEDSHAPFGGIVPELAARAHVDRLAPMIDQVCKQAAVDLKDLDAIAATAGPGLIGGVIVGLVTGKALALALDRPLIAVNHLEAHALSPRLVTTVDFPYLLMLASGGHCQILKVEGVGCYRRLGTTIDDAVGEAFDKTAKILKLGFPGGAIVEARARLGDPGSFQFPRPLIGTAEPNFSFSGLKTAVLREVQKGVDDRDIPDICAAFQAAIVDCLVDRVHVALNILKSEAEEKVKALVCAGGVASNQEIRAALETCADNHGLPFVAPPAWLCTDNAAMVAWAGIERYSHGLTDELTIAARARWPLDEDALPVRGAGVKA